MSSLLHFLAERSPDLCPMPHLAPVAALFEAALERPVAAAVHIPPGFGASTLFVHALAHHATVRPRDALCYVAPSTVVKPRAQRVQSLAPRANLHTLVAGGQLTGQGFRLLVVDGLLNQPEERFFAPAGRWLTHSLLPRLEADGSVIVVERHLQADGAPLQEQLRPQGPDDGASWSTVIVPALAEDGGAVWPERWSVPALIERRQEFGEDRWAQFYEGANLHRATRLGRYEEALFACRERATPERREAAQKARFDAFAAGVPRATLDASEARIGFAL